MTQTFYRINGVDYAAEAVTVPESGRDLRDAWAAPDQQGIVLIDETKKQELLADKVNAELNRRLSLAVGMEYGSPEFVEKRTKFQMQYSELVEKKADGTPLTGAETTRLNAIKAKFAELVALQDKADTLLAGTIPDNYDDDSHWT